jgi:adenosylhomocysteine nucleosidase
MTTLILAAMPEEEQAILRELAHVPHERLTVGRRLSREVTRFRPTLSHDVIVAPSGMGCVNAALTLALIAESHPLDAVYLLGVAGALREDLALGELVIATSVLQHDYFSSLESGHFRMRAGTVVFDETAARAHTPLIPTSSDLVARLSASAPHVRRGIIASGNEFVGTTERKHAIAELHPDILIVDMEAAGVAQTALQLGIPFAVAKTVADRLRPDGSIEQDFNRCLHAASRNAARLVPATFCRISQ